MSASAKNHSKGRRVSVSLQYRSISILDVMLAKLKYARKCALWPLPEGNACQCIKNATVNTIMGHLDRLDRIRAPVANPLFTNWGIFEKESYRQSW